MSLDRIFEEREPAGWQSHVSPFLGHAGGQFGALDVGQIRATEQVAPGLGLEEAVGDGEGEVR